MPEHARIALAAPPGTTAADRAVVAAQEEVRRDPTKDDVWVALGRVWIVKARATDDATHWVNADACASVVLARDPDHVAASDLRAVVLARRHEHAHARTLAERITARRPDDPRGWANLTDALLALGRYEEAKDAARKLLELGPDARAYELTARIQWLHGDVARAKESIDHAIEVAREPHVVASALVARGTMAWHAGEYDDARRAFEKALEHDADCAPAHEGKGRVAMAKGEWSHAIETFARSYELAPRLETAWLLGDARAAAGDAKGAEDAYALVAKHAPNDPLAYSRYLSAKKESTKEQRSEALRLASEVHVKQYDVHTEDALAWALFRAGMVEPSKTSMGRARRLHTPDARFLFHEGAIRIAAGDLNKGRETVANALALNRAFDWREAKEARELLTR